MHQCATEPMPSKEEVMSHVNKFMRLRDYCKATGIKFFAYGDLGGHNRLGDTVVSILRTQCDIDYNCDNIYFLGDEIIASLLDENYYDVEFINQIDLNDDPILQQF